MNQAKTDCPNYKKWVSLVLSRRRKQIITKIFIIIKQRQLGWGSRKKVNYVLFSRSEYQ